MDNIKTMRIELRENEVSYFADEELQYYIEKNSGNINNAIYECLIIKSQDTSLRVSGLTTSDTSKYFLRLSQKFRPINSGILGGV